MATINGKTIAEVLDELRSYKGKSKDKDMGQKSFDYYPIEEYVQAFNNVIGADHYAVEYSELSYHRISSGQDMLTVKCTITLYGDDGFPVLHKEGYGGSEFSYQKGSGRDGNLNNAPHTATTSAFKSAAKWFGVFNTYMEPVNAPEKPVNNKSSKTPNKTEIKVVVHTKDGFFKSGVENRTKKDIWKVKATLASDNSDCEIVFYPNQYGKDEDTFLKLRKMSGAKSVELRMTATDCGERDGVKQFVFKDYLKKTA